MMTDAPISEAAVWRARAERAEAALATAREYKPVDAPESGDFAQLVVPATWRPCAHGGGWWETTDVDGGRVLLGAETPALIDTPQPAPDPVAQAARVLLDQPYHVMSPAFYAAERMHGEGADRIIAAALRAMKGGE